MLTFFDTIRRRTRSFQLVPLLFPSKPNSPVLVHRRSLVILFLLMFLSPLPDLEAQSTARVLDALLQDYAFKAFHRPKTGIPYSGVVPSNLSGIQVSALRLVNGSLRRRGVKMYERFAIPAGVIVTPYVKRLALVYQNLGNWSQVYYPLPDYTYLAPVLGLLAYDAGNLSATNLPELDLRASIDPISVVFSDVKPVPSGFVAKCVRFDLQGLVIFSDVASKNTCSTIEQGHFGLVVESISPVPAPAPSPVVPVPTPSSPKESKSHKVWIIVGSILGGIVLLLFLLLLVLCARNYKQNNEMHQMQTAGDWGESLRIALVGGTKAPAATVTRTQPTLETEYTH